MMRSSALDRRVRKEASALVREAKGALAIKSTLKGNAGDLAEVTKEVEAALVAKDYQRVRKGMPALDALVDELIKRPAKSTTRDFVESIGAAVLIAFALRAFVIEAFKIPSSSMYPTLEIGDHIFVNKFIYGVRIPFTKTKLFELRAPKRGEVIVFQWPCNTDKDYIKRVVALPGDTVEVRCSTVYVNGQAVPNQLVGPRTYIDKSQDEDPLPVSVYRETVNGLDYETFHDENRPRHQREWESNPVAGDGGRGFYNDFPRSIGDVPVCTDPKEPLPPNPPQIVGRVDPQKPGDPTGGPGSCRLQYHYTVPAGHIFAMGDNRDNSNDSRKWGSVPIENIKGKALFLWLSYQYWSPVDWSGMRWSRIGNFVH